MFTIFVPTADSERSDSFYRDVMGFDEDVNGFILSDAFYRNVRIQPQEVSSYSPPLFHLFRFQVESNFLSFCKKMIEKGLKFNVIGETPGGYAAVAEDVDGNKFEIVCESFEEDSIDIDPTGWPCFRRY